MSAYWIGLLTVPVIFGSLIGGWVLLGAVTRLLPIIARLIPGHMSDGNRNATAGLIGSARRGWRITFRSSALIFIRDYNIDEANQAKKVLDNDGPWRINLTLNQTVPAAPKRDTQ